VINTFLLSKWGAFIVLLAVAWLAGETLRAWVREEKRERHRRALDRAIEAVEIARGRLNYCRSEWFDFHLAELKVAEEKLDKKIKAARSGN